MALETRQSALVRALVGGVVAGVAGGVVLSLFLLGVNLAQGRDLWVGVKMPALPLLGTDVLEPGFELSPVLAGAGIHFAISIFWGLAFALFVYGTSRLATVGLGAAWGIVVWIGMYYVGLPLIGLNAIARGVPLWLAVSEHVLFGLAVGLGFLPFQRARVQSGRKLGDSPLNP